MRRPVVVWVEDDRVTHIGVKHLLHEDGSWIKLHQDYIPIPPKREREETKEYVKQVEAALDDVTAKRDKAEAERDELKGVLSDLLLWLDKHDAAWLDQLDEEMKEFTLQELNRAAERGRATLDALRKEKAQ